MQIVRFEGAYVINEVNEKTDTELGRRKKEPVGSYAPDLRETLNSGHQAINSKPGSQGRLIDLTEVRPELVSHLFFKKRFIAIPKEKEQKIITDTYGKISHNLNLINKAIRIF